VNTPSTSISPGIGAFIAFFVLAIALWLLMRNMNARMRRMSYRAEEAQRQAEAEAQHRPAGEGDGPEEVTSEVTPTADDARNDGTQTGEESDTPGGR
jgi:hypothetical protein